MTHGDRRGLLLLFDIDGTLLEYGAAKEHARALIEAVREVYAVDVPDDAVTRIRPFGKTDQRIVREVLELAGMPSERIDPGRDRWMQRTWELFEHVDLARLETAAMPGAADALAQAAAAGHTNALLTGNMEAIAYRKLQAAGLADWFERGQGAFGSDAEDRNELVPFALARAGGWPASRTVVVGDAPGDVACALAGGALAVALMGHFDASALAGAHAFISSLAELDVALSALTVP